jgi:HipA-like protein
MRQALVKVHDQEAGILTETDDRQYRFVYHADYTGTSVSPHWLFVFCLMI